MTLEMFNLTGRIALVTGAGRGIGLALARGLASAGASVVLGDRDQGSLSEAVDGLRAEGFDAYRSLFDVSVPDQVERAVADVEARIGPIEILINNAGIQHRAPLEDFPVQAWNQLVAVNLTGVFLVSQAVARRMIERGHGKIVAICSVQSELARPTIAPYTATKGGVRNLVRGMCTDWAQYGLQINGIGPGYFMTDLNNALADDPAFDAWLRQRTPAGRWGDVKELVGAAVFLSSPASSFVNGQIIYVDGGMLASI